MIIFQTIELVCGPICDWFVDNKRRPVNYQAGNMARTRCHALVDGFWKTQMPIEKVVALLPKTVEAMSRTVVVSSSFWNIYYTMTFLRRRREQHVFFQQDFSPMAVREVEGHKKSVCSEGLLNRYCRQYILRKELLFICKELMELVAHKCRLFMQKEKWLKYIFSQLLLSPKYYHLKVHSLFQAKLKCWQEIA